MFLNTYIIFKNQNAVLPGGHATFVKDVPVRRVTGRAHGLSVDFLARLHAAARWLLPRRRCGCGSISVLLGREFTVNRALDANEEK